MLSKTVRLAQLKDKKVKTLPNKNKSQITVKTLSLKSNINGGELSALDLFTPLSNKPWSTWLDSCDSDHIDSRFDIIVWQPEITLCTYGDNTQIHQTNVLIETSNEDPLALLNKYQNKVFEQYALPILVANNELDLPFVGGSLGYFAYDLGRRFETLPEIAQQDIELPDMAIGIYSQAVIFDKNNNCCYLICPENSRQTITDFLISELKNSKPFEKFSLTAQWQSNMNKSKYSEKFTQVKDYLLDGDCYQINLAQRFSAQYQGDEFQAYKALRTSNNAPFSAFMRLGGEAAILSISPERFLSVIGDKVQSKPIKGTLARNTDPEIDQKNAETLQQSSKDRAENVMIVDLLRNDISKVCQAGSVVVPELFTIESFPAVHHLVSTVEGKLAEEFNNTDLLRGAFPGGSITGAPKIRAMEIIEELEPHRRSVYCGSMGYLSACGKMDTSITIRTLVCQQNTIYCWAGGGLVADSTLDSEYQETYDKVHKILPVLSKL
ncbi:MAG: aminodeoxychorismate synthase component I [Colwellia sp.]|nr:aminodeoxychorismate synthase component I [Colwellia sp.]